jgi:cytosine/uracil/thiamine/allantoin permease
MSIENSLGITGNLNIRIHRDVTGKMWFGVR